MGQLYRLSSKTRTFVCSSSTSPADALDSAGNFHIDPDVVRGPENMPIVSASRARELAGAFAHSYGPAFRPFCEQDRGGSIDLAILTVSTRVYPAQTVFDAIPQVGCDHSATVHSGGRRRLLGQHG